MTSITTNINGWMKRFEVDDETLNSGVLYVAIYPPMEIAIRTSDIVAEYNVKKVRLVRTGKYLFKYLQGTPGPGYNYFVVWLDENIVYTTTGDSKEERYKAYMFAAELKAKIKKEN